MKNGAAYVINLDRHKTLEHIGLFCTVEIMKLFTLILLVQNMFLKKLKNLLVIKTSKQKYLEYKQAIQ